MFKVKRKSEDVTRSKLWHLTTNTHRVSCSDWKLAMFWSTVSQLENNHCVTSEQARLSANKE